jgi:hypothetical protein
MVKLQERAAVETAIQAATATRAAAAVSRATATTKRADVTVSRAEATKRLASGRHNCICYFIR